MITIMNGTRLVEMVHEDDFQCVASGGGIEILIQPKTRRMLFANGIVAVEPTEARSKSEGAAYLLSLARRVNPDFQPDQLPADARRFFIQ